jgi:rhamnose transport system permease protein
MLTKDAALPDGEARKGLSQFALRFRVSGVAAFLLLLGLAFTLLRPHFIEPGNLSAIISNAAILAIVAAAQALVLITRNLDVSVGSIMGFSASQPGIRTSASRSFSCRSQSGRRSAR